MSERPQTIRLADYQPPSYEVTSLALDFALDPAMTRVVARTVFHRRGPVAVPLRLDGEHFVTERLAIDGRELTAADFAEVAGGIVLHAPPATFELEVQSRLDPAANTALSGLYLSGGRFCTQCEAEGFRRITYALDRPDVMTRYTVRLAADRQAVPTLLCNGNPVDGGDLPDGRHFAVWHDPHPKPTYLFALAAGRYESLHDTFVTRSGRPVAIGIHVDPGELSRAHYALDSLRRAMRWDEQHYEREYDLDVFNLVAVRDFNFGAMENKGLNIFNAAYVLADPESATDADYEGIEAVVGHEYFHNWTGNRITCRDWFQLSLKEGLTVLREHQFAADQRSAAVQRIKEVRVLRLRQFAEDAGPLAHPVRPASYQAIDNFYTATVYEKGAEVIRMLRLVIGEAAFARGMQVYFTRRDGTASTVEDLVGCFAEAAQCDLGAFMTWYEQAGTPQVTVRRDYDAAARRLRLEFAQHTDPTPGQPDKQPLPIPLRIGAVGRTGAPLPMRREGEVAASTEHAYVLHEAQATVVFVDVEEAPVPAVHRGFCAPVQVRMPLLLDEQLVQMAHDPDPFTRWEAGQTIARDLLLATADAGAAPPATLAAFAAALRTELDRAAADPAFAAQALRLPDLPELVQLAAHPDPEALFAAREACRRQLAAILREPLATIAANAGPRPFSRSARAAGERALRGAALDLLASLGASTAALRRHAFAIADNMTDTMTALESLAVGDGGGDDFDAALQVFHRRWHDRPLVLDKWFAVQAVAPRADALARVVRLSQHPDFELRNPNRVRSLVRVFATANLRAFHAADGSGYAFVAEVIGTLDGLNPALAAKLLQAFENWRRFDAGRQAAARRVLGDLAAAPNRSKNLREMLDRTLA